MIRRRAKIRKTHSWHKAKRTLKRLGGQIGASSGMKRPPIAQRRFNLDEPRRYFQNRRDSVLLAQQRIFKAGGVSPERVMHRDSVSIARKRMREKNAAQLAARDPPARLRWCLNDFGRSRIHRPQMAEKRRTRAIQHRRSLLNQLKAIGISESWNEGTSFERLWLGMRHAWSGGKELSCG